MWPAWAQRQHCARSRSAGRLVGLLLEVDTGAVRKVAAAGTLLDDVLRTSARRRAFLSPDARSTATALRCGSRARAMWTSGRQALVNSHSHCRALVGLCGAAQRRHSPMKRRPDYCSSPSDPALVRAHPPIGRPVDPDHRAAALTNLDWWSPLFSARAASRILVQVPGPARPSRPKELGKYREARFSHGRSIDDCVSRR